MAATGSRFDLQGRSLRQHAARGTVINAVFLIAINGLGLVRGFLVAGFLSTAEYGVWGVVFISLGTLLVLREIGVSDRYVQQDDEDQERAFQLAFTLECIFTGATCVLLALLVPLIALVYGRHELLAPGFVLITLLPALALQSPLWVFYRRMEFARQRSLQAIDPVVGFVVAVGLAAAGAGYWALIAGTVVGAWAAAIVSVRAAPYPLKFRFDGADARAYLRFSWPIAVGGLTSIVIAQGTVLAGSRTIGLAGVGAITLASAIIQYSDRVDQIVTQTLYPAIAAVKDKPDLLLEVFVKSNRVALMWGAPFGIGLTLFAHDLVHYGLGDKWDSAVILLQVFGVLAAINHVGFNWSAFWRARGDTRPVAITAVVTTIAFLCGTLPLLIADGIDGLAWGMAIMTAASLSMRAYYVTRLFHGFGVWRHALRGLGPTVPAALAVLGVRAAGGLGASGTGALAELALFGVVYVGATLVFERALIREAAGYLRSA
jgi:PST family polysaccharide transporter